MQAWITVTYIGKQIKFMFLFADPLWKRSLSQALLLFCSVQLIFFVSDGLWWLDANSPMLSYFAD
jgi:hypothetical protein